MGELGFHGLKSNSSLFIFKSSSITLLALMYVDDLILTRSNLGAIDELIHSLSRDFPIMDLGELNFFLGIIVTRVCEGLHLSKSRYISGLLPRTKMSHAKPITSPRAANTSLNQFFGLLSVMLHFIKVLRECYNISHLPALTLPLLSIKCLNLCMLYVMFIGLLSKELCAT
jgi:hypothetical protein